MVLQRRRVSYVLMGRISVVKFCCQKFRCQVCTQVGIFLHAEEMNEYKVGKLDSLTFNLLLLLVFFSMKVGRNEQVVCSLRHLKGFLNIEAHEFKELPLAAILEVPTSEVACCIFTSKVCMKRSGKIECNC